jgi:hypothetical protein
MWICQKLKLSHISNDNFSRGPTITILSILLLLQRNQCCGSGMFIPDPDFYPSRIPDPKTATKERGEKFFYVIPVLYSQFHKNNNYFSFEVLKKKIWANFLKIIELFTQKIVTKLSKIWVWDPGFGIRDPGSGKNLFRIPDPGVKKAPDPGSGSATLEEILH